MPHSWKIAMGYESSKSIRFRDDSESTKLHANSVKDKADGTWILDPATMKYEEEVPRKTAKSLKAKLPCPFLKC
nr:hypothetical protein CFP56_23704 [Quercus suber]